MNLKLLLLSILLLGGISAFAQNPQASEIESPMSLGNRPGFVIQVDNVSLKSAENLWYEFVKDEFGSRPRSVKGFDELKAEEAKLKSLSKEQFNLHSSMKASGDNVMLTVWFDMGTTFLNGKDTPNLAETAKAKLVDFYYFVQKDNAKNALKDQEDKLKDAEKALSKLVDDGESINKDIRNYEDKVQEANREKEKNQREQSIAKTAVEEQRLKLEEAKKALEKIGK
jgi:peptidoglycan hydrolase CwlO-like protein